MGCGSSGNVVGPHEGENGTHKMANGTDSKEKNNDHHNDGLPTVTLPDTPIRPKPPIAFEIPLDDPTRRPSTPPPHLQRLLQPLQAEISLPDIEEKLAEAEQRRLLILQQRAASAQKRSQKMMKSFREMDRVESDHEPIEPGRLDPAEEPTKQMTNTVRIPQGNVVCEDKNI